MSNVTRPRTNNTQCHHALNTARTPRTGHPTITEHAGRGTVVGGTRGKIIIIIIILNIGGGRRVKGTGVVDPRTYESVCVTI